MATTKHHKTHSKTLHKTHKHAKKKPFSKGILFGGIAGVFIIILIILGYSGFFSTFLIEEREFGPIKLVYEEHIGPYQNVGPTMDSIYEILKEEGIDTYRGVGLYYDDPKETLPANLRSKVGAIIEEEDYDKLSGIIDKYNTINFDARNCLYVEFPYKNQLSIIAGVLKVYPKLTIEMMNRGFDISTMTENAFIMEVYDVPNQKILYIVPLPEMQDDN